MRIDGAELYVAPPAGEGELLVLVHGGWTDNTTWGLVAGPLARSFRVVRYDRRGHSRSERGPGRTRRRRDEDDLAAIIEAHGREPAHVLGTSYGAAIALALAGRRPELVRSVVAHEPALLGLVPMPAVLELFDGIRDQLAAGDAVGGTRRFFEDVVLGPGGWELVPEPVRHAAIGNAQTFVDMLDDPGWGGLDVAAVARYPGPILVTHGDAGPAWLPQLALAVAAGIGRPARLIAGAGHTPHHTHPEELAAVVEEVAGVRTARRAA
jgi:pimeloyl-ACP methyl ester carboxylesterase